MTNKETGPGGGDREVVTAEASDQKGTPVETETKARVEVGMFRGQPVLTLGDQVVQIGTEGLRAIVQSAYDQHGILAEPSLEVERWAYEARQAEAEDTHLRTFADAWGEALRNRS